MPPRNLLFEKHTSQRAGYNGLVSEGVYPLTLWDKSVPQTKMCPDIEILELNL